MIALCPGFNFESFVILNPLCKAIPVKINLVTNFENMGGKSKQNQPIHFYFEEVHPTLKNRNKFKTFISYVVTREKRHLHSLNYILCRDEVLLEINREYLAHDYYTDVISFDLSSTPHEILADIYISVDRVKENAKNLKLSFTQELHRVMVHGLLHLCGYNDKTDSQRTLMRNKESFYLNLYFTRFT